MEDRLTTVKTRKQQELIEIGKFLSTYESDCEKYREHKIYIFLQKGANLERQYEDRVQKMLSELREVSRLIQNYINCKCCVCLLFCVFG